MSCPLKLTEHAYDTKRKTCESQNSINSEYMVIERTPNERHLYCNLRTYIHFMCSKLPSNSAKLTDQRGNYAFIVVACIISKSVIFCILYILVHYLLSRHHWTACIRAVNTIFLCDAPSSRNRWNNPINVISPETRVPALHFRCWPYSFRTVLFESQNTPTQTTLGLSVINNWQQSQLSHRTVEKAAKSEVYGKVT